ncbi:MAG: TRIC cation channel family protein [Zavarzinia sp.]|nr:TRIC cation channel family protein [Zavarzinia sp.]
MQWLILVLDQIGIFVFAISGAALALRQKFDLFGVLLLAFVTALAGGILRDLLLGATPPETFQSGRNAGIALAGGIFTIIAGGWIAKLDKPVRLFDAIGLGLFAAAGTGKALAFGVDPVMAPAIGMVVGIGGGMLRDLLVVRAPLVLQAEIYAVAALAGGYAVVAGEILAGLPPLPALMFGAALCLVLRLLSLYRGWTLWHPPAPPGL